jgi:predicted DNA-binding ribbon-helix-helix protein
MKSPVVKRSIVIAGHKTSVSLEDAFWRGLKDIAVTRHVTLSDLVGSIDSERKHGNLSSAIRLFVLDHYQSKSAGHISSAGTSSAASIGGAPANPAPREMMMVPPGSSAVLRPE